jgi:hypothetical protein
VIRLYADGGGLRFAGKDTRAERLAAREIRARRREFEERLHVEHMALLGEREDPTRQGRPQGCASVPE